MQEKGMQEKGKNKGENIIQKEEISNIKEILK